jgi:hypothetical protein
MLETIREFGQQQLQASAMTASAANITCGSVPD